MLCKSNSMMCEVIFVQQHVNMCSVTVDKNLVRSYIDATACCVKLCKCKGVLCHLVRWCNGALCEVVQCFIMFCEMIFV